MRWYPKELLTPNRTHFYNHGIMRYNMLDWIQTAFNAALPAW